VTGADTATSAPGRVLLVDDHDAMRSVLRSLLEEVGGWEVVGEAADGEQAVELVGRTAPDVVLMDCKMPGVGGVAATKAISERFPRVAVVAHTAYADEAYVREMVAAGARGYVLKGDAPQVVLEALDAARAGAGRLSAGVTGPALTDLRGLYESALARTEQLSAENAALAAAVARLRAADQAREEFLALVGHELRTPATVLLGVASTLSLRPELAAGPDGKELLGRLVVQSRKLASMVDQLLAAGAFAAGRSPALRPGLLELSLVLAEAVAAVRSRRPELHLEMAVPPGCRPVTADQRALTVAVERLVDSLAATGAGAVRLGVAQPAGWTRIELTAVEPPVGPTAEPGSAPAGEAAGTPAPGAAAAGAPGPAAASDAGAGEPPDAEEAGPTWVAGGRDLGVYLAEQLVGAMGGRVLGGPPSASGMVTIELPEPPPSSKAESDKGS
jgi:DNA-binding NarL/FixJ family response regulator